MVQFIARLHPVLVHLPIGILLLACLFHLLSAKAKYQYLRQAVHITLLLGAISAIASCITGYLLSQSGEYDDSLVNLHQWMGITVALLSLLYYFLFRSNRWPNTGRIFPVVLIILVAVTGHLGGSLTHGSDYLTVAFTADTNAHASTKPLPNVQEAQVYSDIIAPIFQSKCYSCHGASRQKGKLRVDNPDWLMKGGKDGTVLFPGKPDQSELMKRVLLDKLNDDHMPPKEKPQLTEKEVALLHWWIEQGASFTAKAKSLQQPAPIKPVLAALQQPTPAVVSLPADVPADEVGEASAPDLEKLRAKGVVILPVAANSHYLQANFVGAPGTTDKDLELLLPLRAQLVWIDLGNTRITDQAASILAKCDQLTRLKADSTGLTDKSMTALAQLPHLQVLNLVGTAITLQGLSALKAVKTLKRVYIYQTKLTTAGRMQAVKLLPGVQVDTGGYTIPLLEGDTSVVKPPKNPEKK